MTAYRYSRALLWGLLPVVIAVAVPILWTTRDAGVTTRSTWCPPPALREAVPAPATDTLARLREVRARLRVLDEELVELISDLDLEATPLMEANP